MNLPTALKSFSQSRGSWLLLLSFTLFFELCAALFQHIMMLDPCVMCIYERVAMLGIGLSALLGALNPRARLLRWLGLLGWAASAYKGMTLAMEHVSYQDNIFATCSALSFPDWAPLNVWAPWFFEAYGDCSEVVWQFLTLSMPQWLVVIYAANLAVAGLFILTQFIGKR